MKEEILEVQKAIVEKHLANDFPLLKKYPSNSIGSGGFDHVNFSAGYELTGLANSRQYIFLPHFEFDIGAYYKINIPSDFISGETIYHEGNSIRLRLKGKNNGRPIGVSFPSVKDLFYLRNLASEGKLSSIPEVNEIDKNELPIEGNQISANFYFRASSTTHGQLVASMKINHPIAEEVIKRYLEVIDKRFDDYRRLEQHFREKDDLGNILWADQNLQSKEYNLERKRLHEALFSGLTEVLKLGNLEYKMA